MKPKEKENQNKSNGKFCSVNVCDRGLYLRGCCVKHYQKLLAYGSPLAGSERFKHGLSKTKEFGIWTHMIQRCYNVNCTGYKYWGGRGIKVCRRWRTSFITFLKDMGKCPKGLTLERINNDGNYMPKNCKWATQKDQARNRRNNVIRSKKDADEIRKLRILGLPIKIIAKKFSSSIPVVGSIVEGRNWK